MVKYVLTPFVLVYFIILYVYSFKVILNFSSWPKNIISWMVIGFSVLGYLTYIYSRPYMDVSRYIGFFRRYFPFMVIPQIAMLGYAISLRIGQYGLTMNRYFVVIFGVWLLVISLYYLISKGKYLILIPLTLTVISLIISIGPWSVYRLPLNIQQQRLSDLLHTSGILSSTGEVIPAPAHLDSKISGEIYAGIQYVC